MRENIIDKLNRVLTIISGGLLTAFGLYQFDVLNHHFTGIICAIIGLALIGNETL